MTLLLWGWVENHQSVHFVAVADLRTQRLSDRAAQFGCLACVGVISESRYSNPFDLQVFCWPHVSQSLTFMSTHSVGIRISTPGSTFTSTSILSICMHCIYLSLSLSLSLYIHIYILHACIIMYIYTHVYLHLYVHISHKHACVHICI